MSETHKPTLDQETTQLDTSYDEKELRWLREQEVEYYRLKKIWDVPEDQEETEEMREARRKSLEILKSVKKLKMEREPNKYGEQGFEIKMGGFSEARQVREYDGDMYFIGRKVDEGIYGIYKNGKLMKYDIGVIGSYRKIGDRLYYFTNLGNDWFLGSDQGDMAGGKRFENIGEVIETGEVLYFAGSTIDSDGKEVWSLYDQDGNSHYSSRYKIEHLTELDRDVYFSTRDNDGKTVISNISGTMKCKLGIRNCKSIASDGEVIYYLEEMPGGSLRIVDQDANVITVNKEVPRSSGKKAGMPVKIGNKIFKVIKSDQPIGMSYEYVVEVGKDVKRLRRDYTRIGRPVDIGGMPYFKVAILENFCGINNFDDEMNDFKYTDVSDPVDIHGKLVFAATLDKGEKKNNWFLVNHRGERISEEFNEIFSIKETTDGTKRLYVMAEDKKGNFVKKIINPDKD